MIRLYQCLVHVLYHFGSCMMHNFLLLLPFFCRKKGRKKRPRANQGSHKSIRARSWNHPAWIVMHPSLVKMVLVISMLFFTACAQPENDVPTPPKGYWNMTTLKMAFGLGLVKIIDTQPEIPENITVFTDITYKETEEKTLKLDIYHQKKIDRPTPLLVFIHGGSWRAGKKNDYRRYLVDYAQKGYVTATISYRFSQDAPFPAAMEDVVCAIKWLKAHAIEYYIDTDNIAVIGGSAGAHLTMMLAYQSRDVDYHQPVGCNDSLDTKVKAIVNLYGPVDLTTDYARNHPSVIKFIGKAYSESTHEDYWAASPLQFVSPDDPPTLTFHGTIDDIVPIAQADRLDEALKANNVPSYYHRLKGWPHTMDAGVKVNRYCQHFMDEFFEKYLK